MQNSKFSTKDYCIIVPVYNPGKHLKNLESICEFAEVVIIDSESNDGSIAELKNLKAKLVEIKKSEFNHGSTRNLGANNLKIIEDIEYYIFMTQDAEVRDESVIDKLLEPIRNGDAAATYARQLPRKSALLQESFSRYFNYPSQSQIKDKDSVKDLGVKAFFFSNVLSAIRADVFWELGGFPEDVIMNEDMIMAAKIINAGYKIKYVAESEVIHSHEYTLMQQFRRNFDVGVFFSSDGSKLGADSIKGEGLRFVISQLQYVLRHGRSDLLLSVVADSGAKFVGFQLGKRHRLLPLPLKKRMSMHSYHWDKKRSESRYA